MEANGDQKWRIRNGGSEMEAKYENIERIPVVDN